MRVAIIGSRKYPHPERVRAYVRWLHEQHGGDLIIISGRGRGVDTWAEEEAVRLGIKTDIHPADWAAHGKRAGFIRNADIVASADVVVAFWDGHSRGTADSLRHCHRLGRPYRVFPVTPAA